MQFHLVHLLATESSSSLSLQDLIANCAMSCSAWSSSQQKGRDLTDNCSITASWKPTDGHGLYPAMWECKGQQNDRGWFKWQSLRTDFTYRFKLHGLADPAAVQRLSETLGDGYHGCSCSYLGMLTERYIQIMFACLCYRDRSLLVCRGPISIILTYHNPVSYTHLTLPTIYSV